MKAHLFAEKIALAAFAREHVTPQQMDAIEEVYVAATAKLIVDVRRLRIERDAALSEVARVKALVARYATMGWPRDRDDNLRCPWCTRRHAAPLGDQPPEKWCPWIKIREELYEMKRTGLLNRLLGWPKDKADEPNEMESGVAVGSPVPEKAPVEYEHSYPGIVDGRFIHTSDCPCGAWMGGSSSGAPEGIDPFGECPVARKIASDVPCENTCGGDGTCSGRCRVDG
jgi:hypothetical protein